MQSSRIALPFLCGCALMLLLVFVFNMNPEYAPTGGVDSRKDSGVCVDSAAKNKQAPSPKGVALDYMPPLFNPLKPKYQFIHHRLFYSFPEKEYPFEEGVIREFSGLRVRYEYDCHQGKDGAGMGYYDACLSRRIKCKEYVRLQESKQLSYVPERPCVDDEYVQWINIMETIAGLPRASPFVFIELGARWGTWVSRAASVAETLRPDVKFRGFAVEEYDPYIAWANEVLQSNNLASKIEVVHSRATAELVVDLMSKVDRVHMIDVDIQQAELELIRNPQFWKVAQEKIVRMGIGTHAPHIHTTLLQFLRDAGWQVEDGGNRGITPGCDQRLADERYEELVAQCTRETEYGPVYVRDGEITALNPKFL